ncbi:transcriptional regulator, TetR family [Actinoalloteichus cyanogriseus DSM 43889]|uniref:Transcriptional regulator, TetR family n=1 Tax=Actinoalloteichus caeruleus DSM 43889 TaxID=1120930 RepID=A0ABT1JCB2_ACTCY|nr:transcriptional regulator, TetR family [Actinoalloteichus caeruleus DSM 43889]
MGTVSSSSYHHGDLRRALLDQAVPLIAEVGPASASLRELARRTGVSHAAPAHHFGDKPGLLAAVAAEGFDLLADRLRAATETTGSLVEVGVAYVRFALDHPAHFATMFRPDLLPEADPVLTAARDRAGDVLHAAVATTAGGVLAEDPRTGAVAAWSLVHGFATLWSSGALPGRSHPDADPDELARAVAGVLTR